MVFLPKDPETRARLQEVVADVLAARGCRCWAGARCHAIERAGPHGPLEEPAVRQCFVTGAGLSGAALERKLYVLRKQVTQRARALGHDPKRSTCAVSPAGRSFTKGS